MANFEKIFLFIYTSTHILSKSPEFQRKVGEISATRQLVYSRDEGDIHDGVSRGMQIIGYHKRWYDVCVPFARDVVRARVSYTIYGLRIRQ